MCKYCEPLFDGVSKVSVLEARRSTNKREPIEYNWMICLSKEYDDGIRLGFGITPKDSKSTFIRTVSDPVHYCPFCGEKL